MNEEALARALYETRMESATLDKWEELSGATRSAFLLEAKLIIAKLGLVPEPYRYADKAAEGLRAKQIFMMAFGLGVSYATPNVDRNPAFKEQVAEQSSAQADLYLKGWGYHA